MEKIMSSRGRDQAGSMLRLGQGAHTYNSLWRSQDNLVEWSPFSFINTWIKYRIQVISISGTSLYLLIISLAL